MSRTKRKKKARRDVGFGVALGLIGIVLVAALAGVAWWLNATKVELDAATNCPISGPLAVHAIIFDRSDPISQQQGQRVTQRISQLIQTATQGERFDIYVVGGDAQRSLLPILKACSPGRGDDANPLYQNPKQIRQQFEERFAGALREATQRLLEASVEPSSPIVESIKAAAITSFGEITPDALPCSRRTLKLTIISDLIQHSPLNSHFRGQVDFDNLARTKSWLSLRPDLNGVQVSILYALRPNATQAQRTIQNRGHQLFWEKLISNSGGCITTFDPI